ncbi:hypothetical protein D047_5100A, partial [Vibrio parahaemolyticus VPTS-2010_2]
MGVRQTIQT